MKIVRTFNLKNSFSLSGFNRLKLLTISKDFDNLNFHHKYFSSKTTKSTTLSNKQNAEEEIGLSLKKYKTAFNQNNSNNKNSYHMKREFIFGLKKKGLEKLSDNFNESEAVLKSISVELDKYEFTLLEINELIYCIKRLAQSPLRNQVLSQISKQIIMSKNTPISTLQNVIFWMHTLGYTIDKDLFSFFKYKLVLTKISNLESRLFQKVMTLYAELENDFEDNFEVFKLLVKCYLSRTNDFDIRERLFFASDTLSVTNKIIQKEKSDLIIDFRAEINSVFISFFKKLSTDSDKIYNNEITLAFKILSRVGTKEEKNWKLMSNSILNKRVYFLHERQKFSQLLSCFVYKPEYYNNDFFEDILLENKCDYKFYDLSNIINSLSKLKQGSPMLWQNLENEFVIKFNLINAEATNDIDFIGVFRSFANPPPNFTANTKVWFAFETFLKFFWVKKEASYDLVYLRSIIQLIWIVNPFYSFNQFLLLEYSNFFYRLLNSSKNEQIENNIIIINHLYNLTNTIPENVINEVAFLLESKSFDEEANLNYYIMSKVFRENNLLLEKLDLYISTKLQKENIKSNKNEELRNLIINITSQKIPLKKETLSSMQAFMEIHI